MVTSDYYLVCCGQAEGRETSWGEVSSSVELCDAYARAGQAGVDGGLEYRAGSASSDGCTWIWDSGKGGEGDGQGL